MKKILTRIFSLTLALATALSVSAAPLAKKVKTADATGKPVATAVATKKAPAKAAKNGSLILPKFRTAGTANGNVFRKAGKATAPVKAPYKVGARVEGTVPELIGSVTYSDAWTEESAVGLYTVPTNASQEFELKALGANANYGGVLVDGIYYTCEAQIFWGYVIGIDFKGYDVETGEVVYDKSYSSYTTTMTYDATTSTVYAIAVLDEQLVLAKVDFGDYEVVFEPVNAAPAGEGTGQWNSIACDSNGQLWGIWGEYEAAGDDYVCTGSSLYKIDKETSETTKIGATGYDCTYMSDATFDTKTNRLFWTVCPSDETGFLTEVNTTTGEATVIYQFPDNDEVTGLAVPAPAAEDGAPAVVTDLAANFTGASLAGNLTFKAPATLYDGSAASGALTYTVLANGEQVATGATTFGADVTADVTVAAAGQYTFTVYVTNTVGDGPKAKVKAFVGADIPEATTVHAEYADGVVTLTWTPVTTSVNGGYLNVDALTYNVYRFPGNVAVAENISATTCTDALAVPDEITTYFYTVEATADGLTSEPAKSNPIVLGSVVPPFTATFDDSLDGFTVIDANDDGKTWTSYSGHARILYNSSLAMDDWLITPPVKFEGGKLYDIAAEIYAQSATYPERIEVKVGTAADPAAMTTVLLEPTDITATSAAPLEWNATFVPQADGVYFIGFHGISDADTYALNIDNVSISAPKSADGPEAVSGLTVTPGDLGALTATVSFTAPTKTLGGDNITTLTKIELLRDETLVNTWENPAPGAELTYTDNLPADGDYTYSVIAYNASGNGATVSASAYVGVDYPAAIAAVNAYETSTPGEVTITWDAVTTTAGGAALDPSQVKYQIYTYEGNYRVALTEPLDVTTYTYQAVPAGDQSFVQYAVFAVTARGEGEGNISQFFPVGTPYTSFAVTTLDDLGTYILGISGAGGGSWSYYGDSDFSGITSVEGDDFYLGMKASYLDAYGDIYTGLISLEQTVNPGLVYYTYNIDLEGGDDLNEITVSVKEKGTDAFVPVNTVVVNETGEKNAWNRVSVDLTAYAGKTVQICITPVVKAAVYTFVDGIKLVSLVDYDLALNNISAPAKVKAGEDYTVAVTVANEGVKAVESYSVELYAGAELVETKTCEALAAGTTATVNFELSMSVLATEPVVYTAKVVLATDENPANNESDAVTVTPVVSKLPAVTDLAGAAEDATIKLTWSEPDLSAAPAEAVTEDFEDADAFAATYGNWIFIDGDQSAVGGFQGTNIPGIEPGTTTGSFWIWDHAQLGNDTFKAHSGEKYLFALFRYDDGTTDDWAISPELDGSAQTVTFWARSYSASYPEKIRLAYSTGSTEPTDFVEVQVVAKVPEAWTEYTVELPEGAKRFAINSCATGSFMLMVDDVTYVPAAENATLELKGYDVYRDGVKINDALVEECNFADANVEDGKTYEYVVVTVYTSGVSAASNAVSVLYQASGLDSIFGGALKISGAKNQIVISGAAGKAVAVYTVDGKTIFAGEGEAKTVIPAQQGVYVVKAGTTVKKVLVK